MTIQSVLTRVVILMPILGYLIYGYVHSTTMFYNDDFDLLYFIVLSNDSTSWLETFSYWYKQQNDHRILFPRLISYLVYQAQGYVDWRTVVLITNLIWVGVIYILWKTFENLRLSLLWFIPITWLLLHPLYYENVIWPISIAQQSNVVFWQALAIYLYAQKQPKWALTSAIIATFTHGSGVCGFISILILLLLDRNYKQFGLWLAILIATLTFYFYGYHAGQNSNSMASLSNPLQLIGGFLAFFGGLSLLFSTKIQWVIATGALLYSIVIAYSIPKILGSFKNHPLSFFDKMVIGNLLFLTGTGLLASISRSWMGIESMTAPRYLHYTAYLACWVFIVLLNWTRPSAKKAGVAILAAIALSLLSYITFHPFIRFHYNYQLVEQSNYLNHSYLIRPPKSFSHNINYLFPKAIATGVAKVERTMPIITPTADYPTREDFSLEWEVSQAELSAGLEDNQLIWIKGTDTSDPDLSLYLQPEIGEGFWIPVRLQRPALRKLLLQFDTTSNGFITFLIKENLDQKKYRIGIFQHGKFYWTNQNLTL